MRNLFGITDIRCCTIKDNIKNIDVKINQFETEHRGDIIEVQTHLANDGEIVAIILYKEWDKKWDE